MKTVITISVCLLLAVQTLGQMAEKYDSKKVYEYSTTIQDAVKDEIWTGFDFRRFTGLKTSEPGKNFLYFSTQPDKDGNQNFAWTLIDDYFLNHTLEENLAITFHEAFHAFEGDPKREGVKWGAENAMLVFEYQESSARAGALFNIESQILRDALQTKNKNDLKKKVAEFLAVRTLRQSELEPRFVEFEKGAESNEGLAEYAGTKAVALGIESAAKKRIAVPFSDANAKDYLNKKYEILDSITNVGKNIRRKFYSTGSAQGFLLDRLMPDWKAQVQMNGKAVQDLLAESNGKSLSQIRTENILNAYSYEKILAEEEKSVAARKADNQTLLEKTLNQSGKKIVIVYSALTKPAGIRNFDPMNVTMISPKLRVHTRSVSFTGKDSFMANFSQPVVEDLENKRYTVVVAENEIENITADGAALDLNKPSKIRFLKNLRITAENFNLEAVQGNIEIESGIITIHLLDPGQ